MSRATLEHVLHAVRNRPGMFFARRSVHDLDVFLCGFHVALDLVRFDADPASFAFSGGRLRDFGRWLAARLGQRDNVGWERLLLGEVGGDDAAAFDRFFARWDEFDEATRRERDAGPPGTSEEEPR